jgi:hypothetical protein
MKRRRMKSERSGEGGERRREEGGEEWSEKCVRGASETGSVASSVIPTRAPVTGRGKLAGPGSVSARSDGDSPDRLPQ